MEPARRDPAPYSFGQQLQRYDQYVKEGRVVIKLCEPHGLPEDHLLMMQEVSINPKVGDGDVYPVGGVKNYRLSLHHSCLLRLAAAAEIQWLPSSGMTGTLFIDSKIVRCGAVGGYRKELGNWQVYHQEAMLDLEILKEDLTDQYSEKAKRDKKTGAELTRYVDFCVSRDYREKRRKRVELCNTSAKSAVIRKLLGIKTYTADDFKMPWVVVRCIYTPPMAASDSSVIRLFGPQAPQLPPPAMMMPAPIESGDVVDVGADEHPSEPEDPTPAELFESYTRQDREQTVNDLITKKGYDMTRIKGEAVDKMSDARLAAFHGHLLTMPDAPEAERGF